MSTNDIRIVDVGGHNVVPTHKWQVNSGQTELVQAGEFAKLGGTGQTDVTVIVDADLTVATDQPIAGLAADTSTETASANGVVNLYDPLVGVVYETAAKSAAAADTQSEIDAMRGDSYLFDVTSNLITIDTAAGDTATAACQVIGGDPDRSTIHYYMRSDATFFGRAQV